MGLSSLDAALSGLRIAQQQINIISNNIANVGTPGFTRKLLPQSSHAIEGVTVGVAAETIIRNVDLNLARDLWTQISSIGLLEVKESYLNRISQFHGPPDKELSVAAELARLQDSFSALADTPEDTFLLASVVNQAVDTAYKINDLADLITTLRNDAQDEIQTVVNRINDLLLQVTELNDQVKSNLNSSRTTALIEDKRDEAIKELTCLIDISFFIRGDGALVVQTSEGIELAGDTAQQLTFSPLPLSPQTYYPVSANGIFVGDPSEHGAVDITTKEPGGMLGGLIELRDDIFPKQTAQLDELAHKISLRFEQQGLRLFTDVSGNVPSDNAPDPTTLPDPTPVEYVGFSTTIRVNEAIIDDNSLLRRGTTGATVQPGSSEVIDRILEFTFGSIEFQQAIGDIDMRTSLQAVPNNTLQNWLGIYSENKVSGSVDLTAYASVADIITSGGNSAFGTVVPPAETDRFTITFDDPDFGAGPHTVTVDLRAVPAIGPTAADDLVAFINADANFVLAMADFNAAVSISSDGELVIESRSDITIDTAGVEPMSDLGFAFLGLNPSTTESTDPYFNIQVGNNTSIRITIDPNDNDNDLLAQLSAVPGLALEDFTISADGFLRMRPGEDYSNPEYGGTINIIGGPFQTLNAGINGVLGPGTVPDTINIVSALFGSFSTGVPVQDISPVSNVDYQSETDASLAPPIPTVPFRTSLLGPGANISTEIIGSMRLVDFSQKMISQQTQELVLVQNQLSDEKTLKEILQRQLLDESGVNLDEELGHLIVVQTAFAASARVISAIDELFHELLNAVR